MKLYSKLSALGAVLALATAFASADTVTLASFGSTGATPSGINNTALSFTADSTGVPLNGGATFDLTPGLWTAADTTFAASQWVSYNAGTAPGGAVIAPNGTYTYTSTFSDTLGASYSGTPPGEPASPDRADKPRGVIGAPFVPPPPNANGSNVCGSLK